MRSWAGAIACLQVSLEVSIPGNGAQSRREEACRSRASLELGLQLQNPLQVVL